MAKAKVKPPITVEQISESYIDYVLTNNEPPKSVYVFSKMLGINESEFYNYFASFEAIESNLWESLTSKTITLSASQEIWAQYSSREKTLSFFYSYIELLKSRRSFIVYSLKNKCNSLITPSTLSRTRIVFEEFAEQILQEGLETGELADRKLFTKRYKDALWIQFKFIVNFWIQDSSAEFEKTDEAIEKGINVTFDLFQRSPIDNLFEYGKFLSQNTKFKEKMGL
ncbi:MAG: TetR family transcriptional regulator C-terminal domain-containing protein [Ginsengibacter sp.]